MTLTETFTKSMKSLKTEAEKLEHKPEEKFFKALKGALAISAQKAAEKIDEIIAGKDLDKVEPKAATKLFKESVVKLYKGLVTLALPKEAAEGVKELLKTSEVALTNAAKPFIKKMGVNDDEEEGKNEISDPKKVDPKLVQAIRTHTSLRQKGQKEIEGHVLLCENYLKAAQFNRTRGKDGIELNRTLGQKILLDEKKIATSGDFFAGRKALSPSISKALDEGPYPKPMIGKLRDDAEKAFEACMRGMATARDIRNKVLSEIQGHEMDLEKVSATFLKDDKSRLEQLGKIEPAIKQAIANKLLMKTEIESWSSIQGLTVEGIKRMLVTHKDESSGYRNKRDETIEAFDGLPTFQTLVNTISRRLVLLLSGAPSEEVKKRAHEAVNKLLPLRSTMKQGEKNQLDFEVLQDRCDELWETAHLKLELQLKEQNQEKELQELEMN